MLSSFQRNRRCENLDMIAITDGIITYVHTVALSKSASALMVTDIRRVNPP